MKRSITIIYSQNICVKFKPQVYQLRISNRFGKILDIIFKETYALIEYPTQQCATGAILYMNEKNCKGETLLFQQDRKDWQFEENGFDFKYQVFGFIEDISVKDELYAFKQYRNNLHASRSIKEMNNAEIKGNRIEVQEARCKKSFNISQKNHLQLHFKINQFLPQHPNLLDQLTLTQMLNKVYEETKNTFVQKTSCSRSRSKVKKLGSTDQHFKRSRINLIIYILLVQKLQNIIL